MMVLWVVIGFNKRRLVSSCFCRDTILVVNQREWDGWCGLMKYNSFFGKDEWWWCGSWSIVTWEDYLLISCLYVQDFGDNQRDVWCGLDEEECMFLDKDEWWGCGGRSIFSWGDEETRLIVMLYVQDFGGIWRDDWCGLNEAIFMVWIRLSDNGVEAEAYSHEEMRNLNSFYCLCAGIWW